MRKLIAGMKVPVDEKIEGTEGYADWVEAWSEDYGLMPQVVACLLGAGICPGYEQYRTARKNEPDKPLPMTGNRRCRKSSNGLASSRRLHTMCCRASYPSSRWAWPTWNSRSNSIATDSDCRPRGCPTEWSKVPRMSRWVKGDIHEAG